MREKVSQIGNSGLIRRRLLWPDGAPGHSFLVCYFARKALDVELAFRRFDDPGKDFGEIGEHVTGELLQATFFQVRPDACC